MTKLTLDISVSLDGFVAGPNQTLDQPLGEGGELLHEWVVGLKSWREAHGLEGGETGPDSAVLEESTRNVGATVMGRRMFSGGEGAWEDDPTPTPGGATSRLSATPSSSSPTTPASRSPRPGAPPSPS
jgi:hypothetical protein